MNKNLLLLSLFSGACFADSASFMGQWGIGVQVGSLSSVTLERPYSERAGINMGIGVDDGDLTTFGDHVWYLTRDYVVHPYAGLGVGLTFDDDRDHFHNHKHIDDHDRFYASARIPVGVNYYAPNPRLNVYLQITPLFTTSGDTDANANIGLRYYF